MREGQKPGPGGPTVSFREAAESRSGAALAAISQQDPPGGSMQDMQECRFPGASKGHTTPETSPEPTQEAMNHGSLQSSRTQPRAQVFKPHLCSLGLGKHQGPRVRAGPGGRPALREGVGNLGVPKS